LDVATTPDYTQFLSRPESGLVPGVVMRVLARVGDKRIETEKESRESLQVSDGKLSKTCSDRIIMQQHNVATSMQPTQINSNSHNAVTAELNLIRKGCGS